MKGRKPKATQVKKAAGNPGKRKLNDKEPEVVPGLPACPEHLSEEARKEWERIVEELAASKVLSRVDRAMIGSYCAAWGELKKAEDQIWQDGSYAENRWGEIKAHPAVGVKAKYLVIVRGYLAEFGLSPSARTRVKANDGGGEEQDRQAAQVIGF